VEDGCCRLAAVNAGDKHNTIPRESEATVFVKSDRIEAAKERIASAKKEIMNEYGVCEKLLDIGLDLSATTTTDPLCEDDQRKVLALMNLIPHGPIKFSHSIPGLVETSNNLASIRVTPTECVVMCSTRSSVNGSIEALRRHEFQRLADLCGATLSGNKPYPGWQPNLDSKVLGVTIEELTKLIGYKPEVTAIHAGLECGIIGEKVPGCDMVAFGPTIVDAHTPQERVQISTVEPFWKLVLSVVQSIAAKK
jgi:dipeptidase D